jgi:thiol-disulfide isomerase/thioredoxin
LINFVIYKKESKMKKSIILLTLLALVSTSLLAVPKKPLFEIFTSSTCPPCANANPILDGVLSENPGEYSLIKYQANWPGSGDPYYIQETGARISYYAVTGVPHLVSNGEDDDVWSFTQDHFDSFLTEETGLSFSVVASIDDNDLVTIETTINAEQAYDAGLKFYAAVLEKTTVGNVGSNYETDFYNVLMALNPDGSGMSLDAFTAGSQLDLVDTIDMSTTFMEQANDLRVVVFIQDDSDQELIQSEMIDVTGTFDDYQLTFDITDTGGDLVEGAEIFLEEYGTMYSDDLGQIIYSGIFPGNYNYDVSKAGLFPTTGVVEIIDQDVNIDIVLEIPGDYFYEDFGSEIPADWTIHATSPDFLYWFDGQVIIFRQNSAAPPLMIVSPEIDLGPGETLFFDAGEVAGSPQASFGRVTDPTDPSTFILFEEFVPNTPMEEYSYDITDQTGMGYLAWQLQDTATMQYFSLDNVRIEATQTIILPPTGLSVDSMTGYFTWESPETDELTGYDVYLDGVFQANVAELEWQFENLVNGASYSAGVAAVYDEGDSDMVTIGFAFNGTGVNNNLFVSHHDLNQNFPNPFNPNTTLNYSLANEDKVMLIVYNMKGQCVKILVDGRFSAGQHSITWDGTDEYGKPVSSGIYFYKMRSGDFQQTKKMILMK